MPKLTTLLDHHTREAKDVLLYIKTALELHARVEGRNARTHRLVRVKVVGEEDLMLRLPPQMTVSKLINFQLSDRAVLTRISFSQLHKALRMDAAMETGAVPRPLSDSSFYRTMRRAIFGPEPFGAIRKVAPPELKLDVSLSALVNTLDCVDLDLGPYDAVVACETWRIMQDMFAAAVV